MSLDVALSSVEVEINVVYEVDDSLGIALGTESHLELVVITP